MVMRAAALALPVVGVNSTVCHGQGRLLYMRGMEDRTLDVSFIHSVIIVIIN